MSLDPALRPQSHAYKLWVATSFLTVGTISSEIVPIEVAGLGVNQLTLYVMAIALSYRAMASGIAKYALTGPAFLLMLIAVWSTASAFWSFVPVVSLVKGTTFIINMFMAAYFASRLDPSQLLRGLCVGTFIAVFLSGLLALALPSVAGTTPFHPDAWRGLYAQKNVLGRACMMNIIFLFSLFVLDRTALSRRLVLLGLLISIAVLVQSRSATSMAGVIAFIIVFPVARLLFLTNLQLRLLSVIFALPVAIIGMIFLSDFMDQVLLAFGRSADLTGRLPLWTFSYVNFETRPFTGFGLDGFFQPWNEGALLVALGWLPEHAHNGLLDMALEIGVIPVAVFLVALGWALSLLPYEKGRGRYLAVFALSIFVVLFLQNITESNLYRSSNTIWIVLVVTFIRLQLYSTATNAHRLVRGASQAAHYDHQGQLT